MCTHRYAGPMPARTYGQHCPLACALDLLGERWTLLVVRELFGGARRYGDLQRGLPGIGTDLLTERLRKLEEAGVVGRRTLPAPASATVYELTERGRELEPAVLALARFGLDLLGEAPQDAPPPPEHLALLLRALFDPGGAPDAPETWVLEAGDAVVAITAGPDGFQVDPGGAGDAEPAARIGGDVPVLYDLVVGRLDAGAALADGRLRVEGDPGALVRMRAAFPV